MKKIFLLILFSILANGCITSIDGTIIPASSETLQSKMQQGLFEASNSVKLPIRTYIPSNISKKLPLIVYLHGAGQNGNDNKQQLDSAVGCLYSFTYDRDDYNAVIVAPQCPTGTYWRDDDMLEALKELIEKSSELQYVDQDRIYITGFSMGGDATWKLALNWPTLMSTIVPVCGGPLASMEPDNPNVPNEMANLNVWAFNNFDDGVVRPRYAKEIMSVLWSINDSDALNFTMNVSGGHSPEKVYKNRDV